MEKINRTQAVNVWERVTAGREQMPNVEEMVLESWENTLRLLQLSRRVQGQKSAQLHSLYQSAQQCTDCLKGICLLINGNRPSLGNKPPKQEPVESSLRAVYGCAMRLLAKMEACREDAQYGPAFQRLCQMEQEQCRQILCLLGSLEPVKGRKG
jgi:hypothetical protein